MATPPLLPSFVDALVRAGAQKGLTAVATLLAANGVIHIDQEGGLISIGTSVVLWLASFAWTWVHERADHRVKVNLLNAPPPAPPAQPKV